jgi:hypothetical protein
VIPQPPQFPRSESTSTQSEGVLPPSSPASAFAPASPASLPAPPSRPVLVPPPHCVSPAPQIKPHFPALQTSPAPHFVPQPPQLFTSTSGFTQLEPQTIVPSPHESAHAPALQTIEAPQAFPQPPQFCPSIVVSTQVAPQSVPVAQTMPLSGGGVVEVSATALSGMVASFGAAASRKPKLSPIVSPPQPEERMAVPPRAMEATRIVVKTEEREVRSELMDEPRNVRG